MRPVVIVGSYTPGLAVIRALGVRGVRVVVVRHHGRDMGYGSRWVGNVVRAPDTESEPVRFLDVLLGVAGRSPGSLLVAASDVSTASVGRHKFDLEAAGLWWPRPRQG